MNNQLYTFDVDTPEDILKRLAQNLQKRRLEKGLSRNALSELSKVPVSTITKFETQFTISLASFVSLAKALGYTDELNVLLSEPRYSTMAELDQINRNLNRKRGRTHNDHK
ncbi:helix-turn-helix domain-containing protein [Bacteroides sp. 519]|uniref:helix-turn-helix domain-containing protein n=1 Tax=Bacteroides sp. 519 TaxID=2302937 RepID=UPI0013D22FA5|nr:helix-turn-helix transcriptional regulator [Bacteroides sp. 519]NDV59229.1 XRE family transcriptional regulator [Bacteroides sp. 519]